MYTFEVLIWIFSYANSLIFCITLSLFQFPVSDFSLSLSDNFWFRNTRITLFDHSVLMSAKNCPFSPILFSFSILPLSLTVFPSNGDGSESLIQKWESILVISLLLSLSLSLSIPHHSSGVSFTIFMSFSLSLFLFLKCVPSASLMTKRFRSPSGWGHYHRC